MRHKLEPASIGMDLICGCSGGVCIRLPLGAHLKRTLAIVCADAPLYVSVFVHLHSESCKKFLISYCRNWANLELIWLRAFAYVNGVDI